MIADDTIASLAAPLELTEAQRIALATKIRLLRPFADDRIDLWIKACLRDPLLELDRQTLERYGITIPAP